MLRPLGVSLAFYVKLDNQNHLRQYKQYTNLVRTCGWSSWACVGGFGRRLRLLCGPSGFVFRVVLRLCALSVFPLVLCFGGSVRRLRRLLWFDFGFGVGSPLRFAVSVLVGLLFCCRVFLPLRPWLSSPVVFSCCARRFAFPCRGHRCRCVWWKRWLVWRGVHAWEVPRVLPVLCFVLGGFPPSAIVPGRC